MNKFFSKKMARTSCIIMNAFLLMIHITFLAFFSFYHIRIMQVFNVFSIAFYFVGFFIILRDHLAGYFQLMAVEVMLHMFFATVCLGCGYAFQLCFLGMLPVYFYGDYFSTQLQKKRVHGILIGVLSMLLFILVYTREQTKAPYYVINEDVEFWMRIVMIVINFAVVILCMKLLIRYVIASEGALVKKADYDALTKMPNRYYMLERLNHIYNSKKKNNYWVAIIDIDDFKKVNDKYGHNFGDFVLIKVADVLMNLHDIEACRWGGEEFLLMGQMNKSEDIPIEVLEKLRCDIANMQLQQGDIHTTVTITMGVAGYQEDLSIKEWIQLADKCLYVGKYNGKNRVVR